jgi:hypothetical protein
MPYLCKRLPPLLLPALKHISVLQPSLSILLVRILKCRYRHWRLTCCITFL